MSKREFIEVTHESNENGIDYIRTYLLSEQEHASLLRVELLIHYLENMTAQSHDDVIQDHLWEAYKSIMENCTVGLVKEEVL